jgi:hypothetical protein
MLSNSLPAPPPTSTVTKAYRAPDDRPVEVIVPMVELSAGWETAPARDGQLYAVNMREDKNTPDATYSSPS